jgi:hypothetical protein
LAQFNPRGTDVSVVLDLMIHDIDIVLHSVNSTVKKISASGVSVVSETPDIANARIEFDNGCVANLTASRLSMKNMRKTRFFQRDAYISVDFLEKEVEIIRMSAVEGEADPLALTIDLGEGKGMKQIFLEKPEILPTNAIKAELERMIKEFSTRAGRKVYDGGGVIPDVSLATKEYTPISRSVVSNNLIFDFATQYRSKHPELASARDFKVTPEIFTEFSNFLSTKEYSYKTESEELLEEWQKVAEREKYFEAAKAEFEQLKQKIDHDKKADIEKSKDQLSELLADEITSRYFYQKGRIESSFSYDNELKKAVEILKNPTFYKEILTGKYVEEVKKKGK